MIQDKLNSYWGSIINSIDIDFRNHEIKIKATLLYSGNETKLDILFSEVSGHYFDYFAYKDDTNEITTWNEIIELAEIHYLPELDNKQIYKLLSNTINFNFLIEIYASRLFIKANKLLINNEAIL